MICTEASSWKQQWDFRQEVCNKSNDGHRGLTVNKSTTNTYSQPQQFKQGFQLQGKNNTATSLLRHRVVLNQNKWKISSEKATGPKQHSALGLLSNGMRHTCGFIKMRKVEQQLRLFYIWKSDPNTTPVRPIIVWLRPEHCIKVCHPSSFWQNQTGDVNLTF